MTQWSAKKITRLPCLTFSSIKSGIWHIPIQVKKNESLRSKVVSWPQKVTHNIQNHRQKSLFFPVDQKRCWERKLCVMYHDVLRIMGDFCKIVPKLFFSFQLSKHSLASFLKEHGKIIAQWASELHSRWAHSRATLAEQVPEAAKHKQHYTGNQNYTLEIELKQKHDLW